MLEYGHTSSVAKGRGFLSDKLLTLKMQMHAKVEGKVSSYTS